MEVLGRLRTTGLRKFLSSGLGELGSKVALSWYLCREEESVAVFALQAYGRQ